MWSSRGLRLVLLSTAKQHRRQLRRALATSSKASIWDVPQGGGIRVDFRSVKHSKLEIASAWQNHCTVEIGDGEEPGDDISIEIDNSSQLLCVSALGSECRPVRITVPEMFDVHVTAEHVDLALTNKIQGDVSVSCTSGTVDIDKIRGMSIVLDCGKGELMLCWRCLEHGYIDHLAPSLSV